MTNWAQFDLLVTGGTGNFDVLVHDDPADLWGHGSDVRLNPRSAYSSPSRQAFERFLTQLWGSIDREDSGVREREIPGASWREYRAQIICVEGKQRKSRVDMRPPSSPVD
ncbi:hypothetical protein CCUS01_14116 [Colletotrichum cuscutae]|uniref:Uncharacterized protein n=1 Tax=Colletotrichum cuscutae TaxID=1209917 RepID=A0AAI9YA71_9PEZI|nr:hypothetical protein CCUS01_14116 [Colletotrichum cuscutae]